MLKIFECYSDYKLKPKIEVSDHAFKITLPNVNFSNYEKKNNTAHKSVSKKERKEAILELFDSHEAITRKDIEIALNVSQATAVLIIREMIANGQLIKEGSGKYTRYILGNL